MIITVVLHENVLQWFLSFVLEMKFNKRTGLYFYEPLVNAKTEAALSLLRLA